MEDAPNVGREAATQREAGVKGSLTSALDARAGPRAQALSPGLPRAPGANWTEPGERGPERHQAHEGEITPRSRQSPIEAKDQDPKHEAKGPIQGGRVPHDASLSAATMEWSGPLPAPHAAGAGRCCSPR